MFNSGVQSNSIRLADPEPPSRPQPCYEIPSLAWLKNTATAAALGPAAGEAGEIPQPVAALISSLLPVRRSRSATAGRSRPTAAGLCCSTRAGPWARPPGDGLTPNELTRGPISSMRQRPNQRVFLVAPNAVLSARCAKLGSWYVPVGFGPEKKSTSTRPTRSPPYSI